MAVWGEQHVRPRAAGDGGDWLILHNPSAGIKGRRLPTEDLRRAAATSGVAATVAAFDSPEEFGRLLEEHLGAGATRIAVAGGDGTVARAAARLAGLPVALGIVPVGGANNFARAVGVPAGDLAASLTALRDGRTRHVSLGRAEVNEDDRGRGEERWFTETAGVGILADGLFFYDDADQSPARGAYAFARMLLEWRPAPLRLTLDGQAVAEEAVLCVAANTPQFIDSYPVAPGAALNDAVLDVVLFGKVGRREAPRYFRALREGRHLDLPEARRRKAREVRIETAEDEPPRRAYIDAAAVGVTPVTLRAVPGALRVVVPA